MRNLLVVLLGWSLAACAPIGPATVTQDRIDYASAIGDSWKEQTLLNIVKLRYADIPVFLEVAQVIAGYQLQSTLGGSFSAGNFNASTIGAITATGTATAAGTFTDRPTVVYQPLTGVDFLKRLMTPIPPSSVLFVLQSGYSADRVLPIMLDSIAFELASLGRHFRISAGAKNQQRTLGAILGLFDAKLRSASLPETDSAGGPADLQLLIVGAGLEKTGGFRR